LGIEQQAQIIRDYFYRLNNHTGTAPDGTAWPTIDVYIDVIPFLP